MSDPRIPPWDLMNSLTPKAAKRHTAAPIAPLVWWRVKLRGLMVSAERDIQIRTEDARVVAEYVVQNYPSAECVSIRRMKRRPRR